MDNFRYKFNDQVRFREGDVYHTIFPTRAFKKLTCYKKDNPWGYSKQAIATLMVPPGSTVVRAHGSYKKLRTDQVYVKDIEDMYGRPISDDYVCQSPAHGKVIYKPDSIVKPEEELDTNVNDVCRSGIHFFLKKKSAKNYYV
ncbi:hypothetical protein QJ854_gp058 [Moumouvirus goulette]|uniref:Uncharacterized protein n=1 Tax=Moumouvirus goulette TaxID=1247379 RepID=M1PCK6_9VIRU|nr:hypothetical protein QJ854_gp058 [Moumouvirus goulette]AGF85724.1 hypothetical protein glt_00921 [Moumouvirus goulette]